MSTLKNIFGTANKIIGQESYSLDTSAQEIT